MPRTRSDLVFEALVNLNKAEAGQPPASEDEEIVDKKIDGLLKELNKRTVVFIPDDNAIEDEYFESLGILLANRCAAAFGAARDPAVDTREEDKLREMQKEAGADDTVRACYY